MWQFYCISTFSLISEAFVQERFLVTKIGFNLGLIDEEVGTLRININHPNKIKPKDKFSIPQEYS